MGKGNVLLAVARRRGNYRCEGIPGRKGTVMFSGESALDGAGWLLMAGWGEERSEKEY